MTDVTRPAWMLVAFCSAVFWGNASAQDSTARHAELKAKLEEKLASAQLTIQVMPIDAIVVIPPARPAPRSDSVPVAPVESAEFGAGISETIHLHRYFPTGPREFKAQLLAGGPTIVAARHPHTLQLVFVPLNLPPGYPTIAYESDKIAYIYGEETFAVHFSHGGRISTSYNGCGMLQSRVRTHKTELEKRATDCAERLKLTIIAGKAGKEVRELAAGSTERAGQVIGQTGKLCYTALNLVPGYQLLKSRAEDEGTKYRDRAVARVTRERARAEETIKTVR